MHALWAPCSQTCCECRYSVQPSASAKSFRAIPAEALNDLVDALLEQLPEQSSPVVIVVKPDRPTTTPARTNGHPANQGPTYDPALVFVLELATILAMRDTGSIVAVGKPVSDALYNVVRNAAKVHPLVLSRAVYYLLHLLNASQVLLIPTSFECKILISCARNTLLSVLPWSYIPFQASIRLY